MADTANLRFWSDDLDMDLPAILPGLDEALGESANIALWTHGGTSHGRLNHPAVWGGWGMFGTNPTGVWKPADWVTGHPVVQCTWREALRDAWPHTYRILVDGRPVWDARRLGPAFMSLMYDLRGWRALPDGEADRLRGQVLASVIAATRDLQQITAAATADA